MKMTQEDKNLLLKDLCARLPYGVRMKGVNEDFNLSTGTSPNRLSYVLNSVKFSMETDFKPYLRPMSSMTEEEKKEISELIDAPIEIDSDGDIIYLGGYSIIPCSDYQIYIDYLISHHFDYRGLIPMGLAIEAPEGMYKINTK